MSLEKRLECKYQTSTLPDVMKTPQTHKGYFTCMLCAYDPLKNLRCQDYTLNTSYQNGEGK